MISTKSVRFYEGDILVRTLSGDVEKREAYKLRHKVFSEGLQWVNTSAQGLETDQYDSLATSVGLFPKCGKLTGLFRLLPTTGPFMLEKEFRALLQPHCALRKMRDTVEITRLTIDPFLTEKGLSSRMMQTLFKGVYQWSIHNEIRYVYMVVEKRFIRVLRAMGFPCEPISPCKSLPPAGALSVAAILDWEQFRVMSRRKRPWFLDWISTVEEHKNYELGEFPRWETDSSTGHGWTAGFCDYVEADEIGKKAVGRV